MNGIKSHLAAAIGAVISPWLVKHLGIELSTDEKVQLVAYIMAGLMSAMRVASTGPDKLRAWFTGRTPFTKRQLTMIQLIVKHELSKTKGDPR